MQTIKEKTTPRVAVSSVVMTNRGQTYNTPSGSYWDISPFATRVTDSNPSLMHAQPNYGAGVRCNVAGTAHITYKCRVQASPGGLPIGGIRFGIRVGGVDQVQATAQFSRSYEYTLSVHANAGHHIQMYSYTGVPVSEVQFSVLFIAD